MTALRIILKEKYWGKAIGIHVRNHVKNREWTATGKQRSKLMSKLVTARDASAWVGLSAATGAGMMAATGDRKAFIPATIGSLIGVSIEHLKHIRDIRKKLKANDKRHI